MTLSGRGPARINWGHPLARGLAFALVHRNGIPYDAVTGQRAYPTATPGVPATLTTLYPQGSRAATMRNAGGLGYYQFNQYSLLLDRIAGPCSIFVEGSMGPLSGAASGIIFHSGEPGAGDGLGFDFDFGSTASAAFKIRGNNGYVTPSNWNSCGATNAIARTGMHRVMCTADGTNVRYYAQGRLWETASNSFLPNANTNRRTGVFTNWSLGSNEGEYSVAFAWSRALNLSEYQRLYSDPWQLFATQARRLYFDVGGPPADTLWAQTLM